MASLPKWEYMFFEISPVTNSKTNEYALFVEPDVPEFPREVVADTLRQDVQFFMNEVGAKGWEIIQIRDELFTSLDFFRAWLKRQIV